MRGINPREGALAVNVCKKVFRPLLHIKKEMKKLQSTCSFVKETEGYLVSKQTTETVCYTHKGEPQKKRRNTK